VNKRGVPSWRSLIVFGEGTPGWGDQTSLDEDIQCLDIRNVFVDWALGLIEHKPVLQQHFTHPGVDWTARLTISASDQHSVLAIVPMQPLKAHGPSAVAQRVAPAGGGSVCEHRHEVVRRAAELEDGRGLAIFDLRLHVFEVAAVRGARRAHALHELERNGARVEGVEMATQFSDVIVIVDKSTSS